MKKIYVPAVMVLAVACGGGGDVTPPVKTLSDITSMNVGEVRLLNPTDIPNGINLQASTSARDYLIVVANTSSQHDVPANFVVKADKSTTGVFGLEAAADLAAQSRLQVSQAPLARTPQEIFESRVRAFERTRLSLRSRSSLGAAGINARRSAQVATASVPVVGQVVNINVPNGNPAPGQDLCSDFFPTQAVV
ncbi:MAG TPA: hypothetical protein VK481_14320, partial [Gemmatimonadaceae bacterium]|nr:hypothetical protein [Gemmatimonadaceae bacterium]